MITGDSFKTAQIISRLQSFNNNKWRKQLISFLKIKILLINV
jgi:hypothetical protein